MNISKDLKEKVLAEVQRRRESIERSVDLQSATLRDLRSGDWKKDGSLVSEKERGMIERTDNGFKWY